MMNKYFFPLSFMKYGKLIAVSAASVITLSTVLPALADDGSNSSSSSSSSTSSSSSSKEKKDKKKTVDIVCVGAAVAAREAALGTGFKTYADKVSAAFTKRASDLAAAWKITDAKQRRAAIKTAWEAGRKSKKEARQGWAKAHKAAWEAFRMVVKACGKTDETVSQEQAGEKTDLEE